MGVELRFLRLGSGDRLTQQQELLRKEVAGGADAVILSPVDREGLGETLAELSHKPRIVTMETDLSKEGADACVQADNIALGETLGKAALNGVPEGGSVLLVNSVPGRNGITERTEAAAKRLEESQRRVLAAGYLAVEAAVSLLQGERPKDAALEFALVRKETRYDGNRQKLLFPVTW